MKNTRFVLLMLVLMMATSVVRAANEEEAAKKVKYKAGKDLNFEQLVIEGQLKRPELSVVTGDNDEGGNGLLRLRENFVDRMSADAGEEVP
jgi:hypothetical protein